MGGENCEVFGKIIEDDMKTTPPDGHEVEISVKDELLSLYTGLDRPASLDEIQKILIEFINNKPELVSVYLQRYGDSNELVDLFDFFLTEFGLYTNFGSRSLLGYNKKEKIFVNVISEQEVDITEFDIEKIIPWVSIPQSTQTIFFINSPDIIPILGETIYFYRGDQFAGAYIFVNLDPIQDLQRKMYGDSNSCDISDAIKDGVIADELMHYFFTIPYENIIQSINWGDFGASDYQEIIQFLSEYSNYHNNPQHLREWIFKSLYNIDLDSMTSSGFGVYDYTQNVVLKIISDKLNSRGINLGDFIDEKLRQGAITVFEVTNSIMDLLSADDLNTLRIELSNHQNAIIERIRAKKEEQKQKAK